jgi:hypothetical protein
MIDEAVLDRGDRSREYAPPVEAAPHEDPAIVSGGPAVVAPVIVAAT